MKKDKDSIEDFKPLATKLLTEGSITLAGHTYRIRGINKAEDSDTYKCDLSKDGSRIVYGHAAIATSEIESVMHALDHLRMMGTYMLED